MPPQELADILKELILIFLLAPIAVVMVTLRNDRDKRRHHRAQRRMKAMAELERSSARLEAEVYTRHQLAADLHDELGLHFNLLLAALRTTAGQAESPIREDLLGAIGQGEHFYQRMRHLVHRMKHHEVLETGLLPAMQNVVADVKSMGRFSLDAALPDSLPKLDADQCLFLLCMVREGLHNVIKHAHARRVQLTLAAEHNALVLRIADDGRGFDYPPAAPHGTPAIGAGLRNIRQRCQLLGGSLGVQSQLQVGTTLTITIPITTTQDEITQPTPQPARGRRHTGGPRRQPPPPNRPA